MSDDMLKMAKQVYAMRTAGKKKPADNMGQGAKKPMSKVVKKADPAKAAAKPSTKQAAVKKAPETARKAPIEKPVAKKKPIGSMKVSEYNEKFTTDGEVPKAPKKLKPKMAPRAKEIAAEMAADAPFEALERDIPKGAASAVERMAIHDGESVAAGAAEKAAMRLMKLKALAKPSLGSLGAASVAGGITGLALQALMEGVQAEDSNPAAHDRAAIDSSLNHTHMSSSRVAPRSQLANELPKDVKKTQVRNDWHHDPEQGSDQARMENDFAGELKKWPR